MNKKFKIILLGIFTLSISILFITLPKNKLNYNNTLAMFEKSSTEIDEIFNNKEPIVCDDENGAYIKNAVFNRLDYKFIELHTNDTTEYTILFMMDGYTTNEASYLREKKSYYDSFQVDISKKPIHRWSMKDIDVSLKANYNSYIDGVYEFGVSQSITLEPNQTYYFRFQMLNILFETKCFCYVYPKLL